MGMRIIFCGPNNINKLKLFKDMPTVADLKNAIITNIFKDTITNPTLTTEFEDSEGKITLTIETDDELIAALDHLKEGQKAYKIKVQEAVSDIFGASQPGSTSSSPSSSPTNEPRARTPVAPQPSTRSSSLNAAAKPFVSPSATPPVYQPNPSTLPGAWNSPLNTTQPVGGATPYTLFPTTPARQPQGNTTTIARPKMNARFVKHTTVDDESSTIYPDVNFRKTWRFRNDGGLKWPKLIHLLFVSKLTGDQMGAPEDLPILFNDQIQIGAEQDVSVPLKAPSQAGEYTGFWKLADESGKKFGQRVRCRIQVEERPKRSVVLDDNQSIQQKKDHLQRFFPDQSDLASMILEGAELGGHPSLNEILNGTFRKADGNAFTMEDMLNMINLAKTLGDRGFPFDQYQWAPEAPAVQG